MSKRVLLVAVFTVGLVTATPSQAQAPLKTEAQTFKAMEPRQYARVMVMKIWDNKKQFVCLSQLWGKESAWNPRAFNPVKVDGRNAGGIPQILGLSPKLHHTIQIDRGLKYIIHRYDTPCRAWSFWLSKAQKGTGWY